MINSLEQVLSDNTETTQLDFSLNGLRKGAVGMLIAAPNVGKSHLALCLAMEHASATKLIGLSTTDTPKKVLVVSTEDDKAVIKQRMLEKMKALPEAVQSVLLQNLSFVTDVEPFVVPPESSLFDKEMTSNHIERMTEAFKDFDLVIIDTVSEAIGECDEVKHDRLIKNTFQNLAKYSGASILLVHHVNKDEIRGDKDITMASGAGLTTVMRLAKFLITMSNKDGNLKLGFLKANYLSKHESVDIELEIKNGLTMAKGVEIRAPKSKVELKVVKDETPKIGAHSVSRRTLDSIMQEPEHITLQPCEESNREMNEQRRRVRDVL